jgi:hypothetical protein
MILPIKFWTILKKSDFKDLTNDDILDIVEKYLADQRFHYIKRKKNRIVFHSLSLYHGFRFKDFVICGIISVKENRKRDKIVVENGNWMVLLIGLFFLVFFLIGKSNRSTFDADDFQILRTAFTAIFIANFIIRFIAHLFLKMDIEALISERIESINLDG